MARQYVKLSVRGVGGGRMSARKPSAPKLAVRRVSNAPKLAVRRVSNGKRKA